MTIATMKKKRKCFDIPVHLCFECFPKSIYIFHTKQRVTVWPELLNESEWKRKVTGFSTHGKTITRVPSL